MSRRSLRFRLRFPAAQLAYWAARFPDVGADEPLADRVRPRVLARGYLTRTEFLAVCAWKSPRMMPHCRANSARRIRDVTAAAFAEMDEAHKVELLLELRGVGWPTASVILHFCDARPYPILDYRAAWSLGFDTPPHYTMEFWLGYLDATRRLAQRTGLSLRTLDKALWQYSKERSS